MILAADCAEDNVQVVFVDSSMPNGGADPLMLTDIFDSHAHYDDPRFAGRRVCAFGQLPAKAAFRASWSCGVNVETTRFAQSLHTAMLLCMRRRGFHPLNLEDVPTDPVAALAPFFRDAKNRCRRGDRA